MSAVNERALSTVVGYVLSLGIASLLIAGLLVATGGFVDEQREATIRDEMEVIGHQLAADISAADRLVRAGGSSVTVFRTFPDQVAGVPYKIRVDPGSPTTLVLSTEDPEVTVEVDLRTQTSVGPTGGITIDGGAVVVEYTGTKLEVSDGD